MWPVAPIIADDTDLFTAKVDPNVLIIFDTSGSMTFDIWHSEHVYTWGDGSEDYPGRDTNGDGEPNDSRMYNLKSALRYIIRNTSSIRFGLFTYGQKHQWYRAWWYRNWPYNIWNRRFIRWHGEYWPKKYPVSNPNIQVVRVPLGPDTPEHKQDLLEWIDNINQYPMIQDKELRADGGTPIGGTLYWIRKYLEREVLPNDPDRKCRKNFILLLTDGEETGYPYYNRHSPWEEIQRLRRLVVEGDTFDVKTFVVGVGLTGSQQLQEFAELGGTGHYYPATNPDEITQVLKQIFSIIVQQSMSFSSPEVPSISSKYQDKLYFASFVPGDGPFWKGHFKCYQLQPDGTIPIDEETGFPTATPIWDAGEMLKIKSPGSREIYTVVNGRQVPFTTWNVPHTVLGVSPDSVDVVINYIRGDNGYDWKLGDIFHSEAVVVGRPTPYFHDQGYREFRQQHLNRHRIVVVGANDGMLHAFDAGFYDQFADSFTSGTGEELWAFIPPNLLPKLKNLLYQHEYMVDGSPSVSDVWIPSGPADSTKEAEEWHTILVCGERQGGNTYFALDITNTLQPKYLWSFTHSEIGETWSKPFIGRLQVGSTGIFGETWIAAFGGGTVEGYSPYGNTSGEEREKEQKEEEEGEEEQRRHGEEGRHGHGERHEEEEEEEEEHERHGEEEEEHEGGERGEEEHEGSPVEVKGRGFYIVNVATGELIWKISYNDGKINSEKMDAPIPGSPAAVDLNGDGYVDRFYVGDLKGRLWRIDVSDPNTANWQATPIFQSKEAQPIYVRPTVALDPDQKLRIFFGTGDRANVQDTTSSGVFYCVVDDGQTTPYTESDLGDVTHGGSGTSKGWYFRLGTGGKNGEKVVAEADVFAGTVYFTTYQPTSSGNACEAKGVARLYSLNYLTGQKISEDVIGQGLPTEPQISVSQQSPTAVLTASTSTGQIINKKLPGELPITKMIYWKELKE